MIFESNHRHIRANEWLGKLLDPNLPCVMTAWRKNSDVEGVLRWIVRAEFSNALEDLARGKHFRTDRRASKYAAARNRVESSAGRPCLGSERDHVQGCAGYATLIRRGCWDTSLQQALSRCRCSRIYISICLAL